MSSCASPGDPGHASSVPIGGRVTVGGSPCRAYVRLLDARGDFVAEVPTGSDGEFRFYAVAGDWILRAITPRGTQDAKVAAAAPGTRVDIELTA